MTETKEGEVVGLRFEFESFEEELKMKFGIDCGKEIGVLEQIINKRLFIFKKENEQLVYDLQLLASKVGKTKRWVNDVESCLNAIIQKQKGVGLE